MVLLQATKRIQEVQARTSSSGSDGSCVSFFPAKLKPTRSHPDPCQLGRAARRAHRLETGALIHGGWPADPACAASTIGSAIRHFNDVTGQPMW